MSDLMCLAAQYHNKLMEMGFPVKLSGAVVNSLVCGYVLGTTMHCVNGQVKVVDLLCELLPVLEASPILLSAKSQHDVVETIKLVFSKNNVVTSCARCKAFLECLPTSGKAMIPAHVEAQNQHHVETVDLFLRYLYDCHDKFPGVKNLETLTPIPEDIDGLCGLGLEDNQSNCTGCDFDELAFDEDLHSFTDLNDAAL